MAEPEHTDDEQTGGIIQEAQSLNNNNSDQGTEIETSKVTQGRKGNTLRKLTREIWQKILSYVTKWTGETRLIVEALRGDSEVYSDAIVVLNKRCTLEIGRGIYNLAGWHHAF